MLKGLLPRPKQAYFAYLAPKNSNPNLRSDHSKKKKDGSKKQPPTKSVRGQEQVGWPDARVQMFSLVQIHLPKKILKLNSVMNLSI